ncbi:Uncharacterised protein [Yersinia enterocolitica]|nr:Uncharacterised protein [Yersinia enterocolitica]
MNVTLADVDVARVRILDVAHSELAALSPAIFRQHSEERDIGQGINLDAYAVAKISYQRK